jgi:hypothetical protein
MRTFSANISETSENPNSPNSEPANWQLLPSRLTQRTNEDCECRKNTNKPYGKRQIRCFLVPPLVNTITLQFHTESQYQANNVYILLLTSAAPIGFKQSSSLWISRQTIRAIIVHIFCQHGLVFLTGLAPFVGHESTQEDCSLYQ